ncbi:uncharacterized protein LOC109707547 [Ananas comosus]|uniref:Uncharacterized protein LOC109707547 n=1 Tax=Ananas comosus TaxID=4615 RepID=A0A6P5ET48_ANACO|nr:uncharacterized protein LOC109707547 [Ananas comosus]
MPAAAAVAALFPRAPRSAAAAAKSVVVFSPSKPSVLSLSSKPCACTTTRKKPCAALSARPPRPRSSGAGEEGEEEEEEEEEEHVFFDGGAHYGDLAANLALGLTLLWLPLTLAAVSRAFFLRYRFTDKRVTVVSGLAGQDRSDFPYSAVADVKAVPRFIGEWGDLVITLTDGTKVDLRSVPKFREIADYCLFMADRPARSAAATADNTRPRGF